MRCDAYAGRVRQAFEVGSQHQGNRTWQEWILLELKETLDVGKINESRAGEEGVVIMVYVKFSKRRRCLSVRRV